MINSLSKALAGISVGPNPAYGFGPGSKAGVSKEGKEGGPGSGRVPEGESSSGTHDDHRGARIYQSGKSGFRALTPTGHNIGPFKSADLLKAHLDKNGDSFGLNQKQAQEGGPGSGRRPGKATSNSKKKLDSKGHKAEYIALAQQRNEIAQRLDSRRDILVSDALKKGFGIEDAYSRANSAVRLGNPEDSKKLDDLQSKMSFHAKHMKKGEAVSSTSAAPQLRATKKESDSKKKSEFKFKEASTPSFKNHKFEVELIKEGLGNFRDCFFYTKESLKKAADSKLFEGAQSFADHPSEIEEQSRPERSTKDILGYYENVQFKENEKGQGTLVADLVVSDAISIDWATSLMANSIEYAKKFQEKDLIGLSINANGTADPMSIDEFMKSQDLSEPVLAKLQEALAQGITEINVVNELREAQSVDLVTKAGAGGRILQMLEREKKMKKDFRETEAMETEDGKPAAADGATADHADAAQDEQLFAQMIKKYLGKDGGEMSDEEAEAAKHAVEAHKEAGMEGAEAYEAAGKHMQMAMAIGKKMAGKKEESTEESEEAHEGEEGECGHKEGQTPPPSPKSSEGKKESMKIAALSGEVAKLRESVKKYELKDYLDKKMAESGKSNLVTKKFRETLGVPKSKDQIDSTWKVFVSAFEAGAEEVGSDDGLFVEKQSYRESSGSSKSAGFSDCLR